MVNKIMSNLYIGDHTDANDIESLNKNNIKAIVNCASLICKDQFKGNIEYLNLHINDSINTDILSTFKNVFEFIGYHRAYGNGVLVHCFAGKSRSSTIVIGYLMDKYKISFSESYQWVLKRRPIIKPNQGFIKQLLLFENINKVKKEYMHMKFE